MSTSERFEPGLISRRRILRFGASGLVLVSAPSFVLAAAKAKSKGKAGVKPGAKAAALPVALQLYSVRKDCAADFPGTLAKVAEMGFEGVEFAGYHNYEKDPEGLRKKLDELKLKVAGAHVRTDLMMGEAREKTIAFHKAIGCRFLIVPADKRFMDPATAKDYARTMTEIAAALKPHGMFCGYHNHAREMAAAGDAAAPEKTHWDLFAERTPKEVILQQDMGWTTVAGLDPAAVVRRHPGRTRSCHIKAKTPKGKEIIGEDSTDWRSAIRACQEVGSTEWLILEQEDYPDGLSPLDATKKSLAGLKKILADLAGAP
jgi:sugar phosphate isomerase/epimerase